MHHRTEEWLRIRAAPEALALAALLENRNGPLLFHHSGACCGGSALTCHAQGAFRPCGRDVLLGEVGGAPFYMCRSELRHWLGSDLIVVVARGKGDAVSLESCEGVRFFPRRQSAPCSGPRSPRLAVIF